jgi:UDPglucose--hexose-1-phosphate uridylyltransferase
LGQVEEIHEEKLPPYDADCYLCPGNPRAGGKQNPNYTGTFVFDNDFPALLARDQSIGGSEEDAQWVNGTAPGLKGVFVAEPEYGICRVVCFSPRHDLSLPELSPNQVESVAETWIEETRDLAGRDFVHYVQIFENKGAMMGASNPHPHSQMWATSHTPTEALKELRGQAGYRADTGNCLLCEYLRTESKIGERVVLSNRSFTALVPFWAIWPFEVLLLPNRHIASLLDLAAEEIAELPDLLRRLTALYDKLFGISFPYSMGFHQAPFDRNPHPEWHLHAHYYPPLLRSASVRKFMVGFEMLATPQRDLTPESAAERLRNTAESPAREALTGPA